MDFWITGNGRSGTVWLSNLIDSSRSHKCRHELADRHKSWSFQYWSPFPIERWQDKSLRKPKTYYGECHGHIRHYLAPGHIGSERQVNRRAVLLRSPRDLIVSHMNRHNKSMYDLPWVMKSVFDIQRHLITYAMWDRGTRVIWMEDITKNLKRLQGLLNWLKVDLQVNTKSLTPKNQTKERWFTWNDETEEYYSIIGNRFKYGIPDGGIQFLGVNTTRIL